MVDELILEHRGGDGKDLLRLVGVRCECVERDVVGACIDDGEGCKKEGYKKLHAQWKSMFAPSTLVFGTCTSHFDVKSMETASKVST